MKKLFLIFTLLAAMLLSAATALAAVPSIMDNAKLLSNGDKAKVERVLQQVENKYNVRVGVVTVKSIGTKKPGDFANELIDKAYNNGPPMAIWCYCRLWTNVNGMSAPTRS